MAIELKIYLPDRVFVQTKADKVVLPVKEGNLTIIDERAPRSQLLVGGMISLLDENNRSFQSWQIDGGVAEISNDRCFIAIENIS